MPLSEGGRVFAHASLPEIKAEMRDKDESSQVSNVDRRTPGWRRYHAWDASARIGANLNL